MEYCLREQHFWASLTFRFANCGVKYYSDRAGSKFLALDWNTQENTNCKLNNEISRYERVSCIADILVTEAVCVFKDLPISDETWYSSGRLPLELILFSYFRNKQDSRRISVITNVCCNVVRIMKPDIVRKTEAGGIRDYLAIIDESSVRYVSRLDGVRGTKDSYCGDFGVDYGQEIPNPDDYNKANDVSMAINDIFKWQTKFYENHVWSPGQKRKEN